MADLKSAYITNATATPRVLTNSSKSNGRLFEASGVVTPAADQADDTIMRVVRVPSNARISEVLLNAADATTGGAIDIGVYQTEDNGGAVVDRDLFASALALTGGPFLNSDQTFESTEYTVAEREAAVGSTGPLRRFEPRVRHLLRRRNRLQWRPDGHRSQSSLRHLVSGAASAALLLKEN